MKHLHRYIDRLDDKIEELVKEENADGGLDPATEEYLHILFENRKHAKELCHELKAHTGGMEELPLTV